MIGEFENRLARLEAVVNQTIRQGVVTSVMADSARVRVQLTDADKTVTQPLPVLFPKTQKNKAYDLPDVGEHVVCVFLASGFEQGFVVGALYSDQDTVPVSDRDKTHYAFEDGAYFEYDRAAHKLTGYVPGDVEIEADDTVTVTATTVQVAGSDQIDLQAPLVVIQGNLTSTGDGGGTATETKTANTEQTGNFTLTGDLHVTGDITCGGTNPNNHSH